MFLLAFLAATVAVTAQPDPTVPLTDLPVEQIRLPPGFIIAQYTNDAVPDARQLALSQGTNAAYPDAVIVYVGTRSSDVSSSATG